MILKVSEDTEVCAVLEVFRQGSSHTSMIYLAHTEVVPLSKQCYV